MEDKLPYYPELTRVRYYDWRDKQFHEGCCYHDTLICVDGKIEPIKEMMLRAQSHNIPMDEVFSELNK